MKANQLFNSNDVLALDEVLGGIKVSYTYEDKDGNKHTVSVEL